MTLVLNIVGLAPNPWRSQWVNRQQILSRLGRRQRVIYSTGAWTVWDRRTPEWRAAPLLGRWEQEDNVLLDVPPRALQRWPHRPLWDGAALALHAWRLRRRCAGSPRVALVFHPAYVAYARQLKPDCVAYHAYDLFEATPGWSAELAAQERELLQLADLVTCVSPGIQERLTQMRAAGGGPSHAIRVLPNGVDPTLFGDAAAGMPCPADLAAIPHPRLGYVGSLHPQVDFSLIAELAAARPQWQFVLVGARPERKEPEAQAQLQACRARANVHFIGEKAYADVPAYMAQMDVNLMTYKVTDHTWIRAGYPLKLHEYLASGRPVVSADLAAVRPFADVLRIASGTAGWIDAIDSALTDDSAERAAARRAVAAQNTWDARVEQLETWLAEALQLRPAAT